MGEKYQLYKECSVIDKIAEIVKQRVPEIRISKRKEREKEARDIIVNNLGALTAEQLALFFDKIDTDYSDGKSKQGRFGMTFVGNNRKLICENLTEANKWIKDLWTAPPEGCLALVDKFMKEKPIKGAGSAFPSLILYIRDSKRFNMLHGVMKHGMRIVTGESFSNASGATYEKLNTAINQFRDQHNLSPQALDTVLNLICKQSNDSGGVLKAIPVATKEGEPFFTADAFNLLDKLHAVPVAATYQDNKEQFKKHVESRMALV